MSGFDPALRLSSRRGSPDPGRRQRMSGLEICVAALGLAARLEASAPWPRLCLGDASVAEGSGHTSLVFTATLSGPASVPIRVFYASSDGSATAGSDYVARAGTFTIPAGATSATFAIE